MEQILHLLLSYVTLSVSSSNIVPKTSLRSVKDGLLIGLEFQQSNIISYLKIDLSK